MSKTNRESLEALGDDDVFAMVRNNDEQAFEEIYRRYDRRIFAYCLTVLKDREAAEDAYQTTMMTAYKSRDSYRGGNFAAWIFTIARNFCLKAKRSSAHTTPVDELAETIPNAADKTGDDFLLREAFDQAVLNLPDEFRLPIEYKYLSGFSYEEIAEMMNISLSLVKVRIFRAKKLLRKTLQPYMQETT